ncbi:hypothetical protein MMC07_007269 [Pseudocyphellaria aurata]|nr:hypothetical protein [Pseudocyphellaria aurata]
MTYQKPLPGDPHLLRDPTADHAAHVNTHEDIRPPSRFCAENTLVGGRCQPPSRESRAMEKSPSSTQKIEKRKRPVSTNTHCHTKSQHSGDPIDGEDMTRATLEIYLTSNELDRLGMSSNDLQFLWTASTDPPVTKASLSELDLKRIVNDAKLRHDVNFDREVSFRPNTHGEVFQLRQALEKGYWEALTVEFALYIIRRRNVSSTHPESQASPWHLGPASRDRVPLRLPKLFRTIQEILKTLVPMSEWPAVDTRLDVDLLIQQLEKGVCDILALSQWLSSLLLGSCSPMRDCLVANMVSIIRRGVESEHAGRIAEGLKYLFYILENMKLDVANHQIRYLRLLMVGDFVHFEQEVFLRRIPHDENLRSAHSWFQPLGSKFGTQNDQSRGRRFSDFLRGVVNIIASKLPSYPSTFEHDFDRLRLLQQHFQSCLTQAACRQIFIETVLDLAHSRLPSPETCDGLLIRISSLITTTEPKSDFEMQARAVALEIAREAHLVCGQRSLPSDPLLEKIEDRLVRFWSQGSALFRELAQFLVTDLIHLVEREVEAIIDLAPLQILNHLNPPPFPISTSPLHQQQQQQQHWGRDEQLQNGLIGIAKRTAHIAVLHWRVWGPILYEGPWGRKSDESLRRSREGSPEEATLAITFLPEDGLRTPSSSSSPSSRRSIDDEHEKASWDFDQSFASDD